MDSIQSLSPTELLSTFYKLQEERVQTYRLFEEGFQAYLRSAPNYNFPMYRQLVHEITETFNNISKDILAIKEQLSNNNKCVNLAILIGKIQDSEKEKLEMTVKLQLLEKKLKDEAELETTEEEIHFVKQSLKESKESLIEFLEELKYESEDLYIDDEPSDLHSCKSEVDR